MNKEVNMLKEKIERLEKENNELKSKLASIGRKKKIFTEQDLESIRMYRVQGKTIRYLATLYKCSTGLMHKTIVENSLDKYTI